jgi:hypothetical protein
MRYLLLILIIAVALVPFCAAQDLKWEIGGAFGYGISRDVNVSNATVTGKTGLSSGYIATAVGTHHSYEHFSGDFRYAYQKSDLHVTSGSTKATMAGETHTVHYDALVQVKPRRERFRPYGAFGGGLRVFRGTGNPQAFQPLSNMALLTQTRETKPMLSIGGGLSYAITPHWVLRADFRDYVTPFPSKVITASPRSTISGWLHDFSPTVGISGRF